MTHDEHEMLVEYSEMTAFNFNSKEYQEVKKDLVQCKEFANGFEFIVDRLFTMFSPLLAK